MQPRYGLRRIILNTTQIYNGKSWSSGAPMPTSRLELEAVTGANGQIYALGGWSGAMAVATVEIYNSFSNAWASGVPMPQTTCCMGVVSLPARGIYVIGGGGTPGITDQVFMLPVAPAVRLAAWSGRGSGEAGVLPQ